MKIHALLFCIVTLFLPLVAHGDDKLNVANPFNFSKENCLTNAEVKLNTTNMNKSDVLEFAKSQIPVICENLIEHEVREVINRASKEHVCIYFDARTREQLHWYFTKYKGGDYSRSFISPEQQNLHDNAIATCQKNLTPETLMKYGGKNSIAGMYSEVIARDERLEKEQKALEEKNTVEEKALTKKRESEEKLAATIKLAQQTERNFDVKGLSLKLSKQQVIALAGQKHWHCHDFNGDLAVEGCTLEIAQKGCTQAPLMDPRTGGTLLDGRGQPVMVNQQCGVISAIIDDKQLPPEGKKITSVGGQPVLNIVLELFNRVPYEYIISLGGVSPELESGLLEKFGKPTTESTDRLEWISKNETLEYLPKEARIHAYKPVEANLAQKHLADFIASKTKADQDEAQKKAKIISDRKKKDF